MPLGAIEGEDDEKGLVTTKTAYSKGSGLVLNFRTRQTANLDNIHKRIMERHGMVLVAVGKNGSAKWPCECVTPCGYRYYPGVVRLRDLQMSDADALLKRVWPRWMIEKFGKAVDSLRKENDRLRSLGLLTKGDLMLLGRIPGPLVRGVCHDFPEEFSTRSGQSIDVQHRNLEKVFGDLFISKCYSKRLNAVKA